MRKLEKFKAKVKSLLLSPINMTNSFLGDDSSFSLNFLLSDTLTQEKIKKQLEMQIIILDALCMGLAISGYILIVYEVG